MKETTCQPRFLSHPRQVKRTLCYYWRLKVTLRSRKRRPGSASTSAFPDPDNIYNTGYGPRPPKLHYKVIKCTHVAYKHLWQGRKTVLHGVLSYIIYALVIVCMCVCVCVCGCVCACVCVYVCVGNQCFSSLTTMLSSPHSSIAFHNALVDPILSLGQILPSASF